VYAPLTPALVALAVRHRSLTVWTAANPGMPHGGLVGERKSEILAALPPGATVPFGLIDAASVDARVRAFEALREQRGWDFPLIIKPDIGERGAGFRYLASAADARRALAEHDQPVIVQPYHPGPHEAGVFYVREPGRASGEILSVTIKAFPEAVGDGRSTLEQLIRRHPRHRLQAARFLERLGEAGAARVPGAGERVRLAIAGNHCQGTMFLDGSRLNTEALRLAIDGIARAVPGFYFGRFDIRYSHEDDLASGRGLGIIELNGVLSESTNVYDPGVTLLSAYRQLTRQWALAFRIGAANAAMGARVSTPSEVLRLVSAHRRRTVCARAD
jgi:hypothetical protein